MIKIDYTLDIDMDTEKRTYCPSEKFSGGLKNIFKLRGPNSSGKSTFMNIVALGSHGLYAGKVPDSVKDRMKDLLESEYRDLEFELVIHDPVTDTVLKSEKKKKYPDIKVSESLDGGKTFSLIAPESFEKKYNLIYDIPENPVGRLNDLVGEIREVQKNSYESTRRLQKFVEGISTDIASSRSESEIEDMRRNLKKYEEEYKKIDMSDEEVRNRALGGLTISLRLQELVSASETAKESYENFKKRIGEKKDPNDDNKKYMAELTKEIQLMNLAKLPFLTNANRIRYSRHDQLRSFVDRLDNDPVSYITQRGIPDDIRQGILDAKLFAESIRSSDDDQETKLLSELIRVLEPHLRKNLALPEIGSLDKLYNTLTDRFKQIDSAYDKKILEAVSVNAKKMLDSIDNINDIVKKIASTRVDPMASFDESSEEERLKSVYETAKNSVSNYVVNISDKEGINFGNLADKISEFNLLTRNEFEGKKYEEVRRAHDDHNKEYDEIRSKKGALEHNMSRLRRSLETEELKGKSEFLDHKENIDKLVNEINDLVSTLNSTGRKLTSIEKKEYGNQDKNDPFFKTVWSYLGKRLRVVRHVDKEYCASEIDLIDGVILAEDGTKIRLSDMGTGQSQLSYLRGLLSVDDNRKIIALFDEVSTMADSTLNLLLDEFQDLQKKGKLMLGMTVSPAEEIEVEEYGI